MKLLLLAAGLLAALLSVQCLPHPEAKIDPSEITFLFFSRNNIDTGVPMTIGNMNGAKFGYLKSTKFIVHSYDQNGRMPWVLDMKLKYVTAEDCNVIIVDWENPAAGDYDNVRTRVQPVAEVLGTFIDFLVSEGADYSLMHLVGYSIGAHVAGYTGKASRDKGMIGRISGLDPNTRLFDYGNPAERLAVTDAIFVDVLHTCGGWLSFTEPLGHVDFYPNNGESSQPDCAFELDGSCSHNRAHELFTESIWSFNFKSLKCGSWRDYTNGVCNGNEVALMGNKVSTTAFGTFYLETYGMSPFAIG